MPQFIAAIPAVLASVGSAVASGAGAVGSAVAAGAGAVGSALGLGAATAAPAATAMGSLGSLGSFATTLASGAATAFSALSSLRAGQMQSREYTLAGQDAQMQATQAEIAGQSREIGLKQELVKNLGDISTAYAASGIDLSYGVADQARARVATEADQALTMDRASTTMRKTRLYQQATEYGMMARSARKSSLLATAGKFAEFGAGVLNRF